MHKRIIGIALWIAMLAMGATAQTLGGNLLGLPAVPLTSQGPYVTWNSLTGGTGETDFINNEGWGGGGFAFMNTPSSGSPVTTLMFIDGSGKVGVGTTSPVYKLHVVTSVPTNTINDGIVADGSSGGTSTPSYYGSIKFSGNGYDFGAIRTIQTSPYNSWTNRMAFFSMNGNGGSLVERMAIDNSGNVGIGTTNPQFALDVTGLVHTSVGVVFPDGTTQTTAFVTGACGADYAESVDVTGDRTKYEPGDVLVIDPDAPGKFLKSNEAYSTLVAGIYSTKPGFVGRLQPENAETKKTEVPMAMVGRVPTKVSAENGPIKVGDLLVASSTVGRAMKGTDRSLLTGAVIGKALGSLDSGTGVIEVLVTLQ